VKEERGREGREKGGVKKGMEKAEGRALPQAYIWKIMLATLM